MLYELEFPSVNERDQVQSWIYVPAAEPKGIIQLVHGFGEHSRRYLHMIMKFVDAGYIVAADDHVGHGRTAMINNTWGNWGYKGFETMAEDEHKLKELVSEKFPGLPYFIFGHSMGSVITRQFIARYGSALKGAALCGTCGAFPLEEAKKVLEADIAAGQQDGSDAAAGQALMGWMCERCGEIKIGNEWICADPYVLIDHAKDPFDAFTRPTTNLSLLYFIEMMQDVTGTQWAEKVPKELPVYSIGGDQDPYGSYAEGLYQVSNWLISTGHKVQTRVYSGYRHEVHNYPEIRDEVEAGIIRFFNSL